MRDLTGIASLEMIGPLGEHFSASRYGPGELFQPVDLEAGPEDTGELEPLSPGHLAVLVEALERAGWRLTREVEFAQKREA